MTELEDRYTLGGQGGKLRLGAFLNRGFAGNYSGALQAIAVDPTLDINDAMAATRAQRNKYGFYANVEQALADDLGAFARVSWNDGRTEILSYTDVDQSISAGLSLKGKRWGRPDDTIGVGGVINGLSTTHRDFLAAGGLGLLIGDGALRYKPETIFETYYSYTFGKGRTVSADYQFVDNPAYNADRGPVSIFSTRVHMEF